jgi:antitoxin PrlF
MPTVKLNSKGQVTLPKAIRDQFTLKAGDKIDFVIEDGSVRMTFANKDVRELFGCLAHLYNGPAVTIKQMDEGIARYLSEKYPAKNKALARRNFRRKTGEI